MTIAVIDEPQHMRALGRANEIRLAQAALRIELRKGQITITEALADGRAEGIRVGRLIEAIPRWGTTKTVRLLSKLKIPEHRRIGELTSHQYRALVDHFNPPPPQPDTPPPPPPPPPPPAAGMEPERVDARVIAALVRIETGTRTEISMRLREMRLAVDDLDASLARLQVRRAITVRDSADGFHLYSVGPRWRQAAESPF